MRFLVWLLGVFVILLGLETCLPSSRGWTAVWIVAAVLWFFVGCGLGVQGLLKLASGKVGAGLGPGARRVSASGPAPEVKHER